MNWIEYIALGVTGLIFLIGLATSLLPVIPGNFVVWAGILLHKLWMGDASVSWQVVLLTGALTLIGQTGDLLFGIWGAKRFGASWKGAVGALIGACIGIFIPPPLFWLIAGPIIGAVLGEIYAGRTWQDGSRAGLGTIIGGAVAFAVKFGLSLCIVGIFLLKLFIW